jgi:hypothetical protein
VVDAASRLSQKIEKNRLDKVAESCRRQVVESGFTVRVVYQSALREFPPNSAFGKSGNS